MAKLNEASVLLNWDADGTRKYQTGVDRGTLYLWDDTLNSNAGGYGDAIPWSGLTAVNENPSGAEATALYADNIKYLNLISAENFAATIEAYDYPAEFEACDGSATIISGVTVGQQTRKKFAFAYRTKVGSDTDGSLGYKIHIIYGCTAATSARNYQTVNESPEAITFSWEVSTAPITYTDSTSGKTYTFAHVEFDSTASGMTQAKWTALEQMLWGTKGTGSSSSNTPGSCVFSSIMAAMNSAS